MEKTKKNYRPSVISNQPYKRRPESDMIKILTEVHNGRISKRGACEKYGINRNTMALFIKKFSIRTLGQNISNQLLSNMPEENKTALLEKKIKELTKQLEHAKLKSVSLETMIKMAEEDLHIRIKKKRGTKQSKE
jgi:glutamate synthase domain-containing protein 1